LEHWRLAAFSFGRVQHQNNREFFEVVGTGVLVATDPNTAYIVTAKHVFDDPTKQWHPSELRLRFAWRERKSVYDDLGTNLKLLDGSGRPLWLASEDGADIAAIPITISELHPAVQPHAISITDIASGQDMFEGGNVLVLGYPGIVGNEYLVRAISRGGIIAWLNPEDPYRRPFPIDANIYPGNSGGPVIEFQPERTGTVPSSSVDTRH
jgi:S1-C subfamily serine protease